MPDAALADAGPDAWRYDAGPIGPTDEVDVLVVVDDRLGPETQDERGRGGGAGSALAMALTSGDVDGDGMPDAPPVRSLHVGVINGDLGAGSVLDGGSCLSGSGRDAVLLDQGPVLDPDCVATYTTPFIYESATDRASAQGPFCVARGTSDGCFYQQPLEAALEALSPAPGLDGRSSVSWTRDDYLPPTFRDGAFGHGGPGGANDGLLRADSVLVVLFVTPIDDCSTPEPEIFSQSHYTDVPLPLRCQMEPEHRYPIERYVDGLLGLRRSPSRLVVAAVTGLAGGLDERNFDAILADPRMSEVEDPSTHYGLQAVCTGLQGPAWPGRRFVTLLRDLDRAGAQVVLRSACQLDDSEVRGIFTAVQVARAGR